MFRVTGGAKPIPVVIGLEVGMRPLTGRQSLTWRHINQTTLFGFHVNQSSVNCSVDIFPQVYRANVCIQIIDCIFATFGLCKLKCISFANAFLNVGSGKNG